MINPEFGYYICDGVKFEKKIEALVYSNVKNKPVEWYFQDHIYSNYTWNIEPEETLDELYYKRARELRERYDYLILCFSGGSDSYNVLEAFIRQHIHLDEIVTVYTGYVLNKHANLNVNDKSNSNLAAEHVLNAIPRLKYASEKLPKTKITVVDDTDSIFKSLKNFEDEDWFLKRNDHLGAIAPSRFNFFNEKELRVKFDKYERVGIIYGRDKPKIRLKGNDVYTSFSDVGLNTIKTTYHNPDYNNITTEYFYWNSSCLPMLAKQAHVIKNWLENTPAALRYWREASGKNRALQEDLLRSVIYTTWNNEWFQVEKKSSQWNRAEDWFEKDALFARENMLWKRGIAKASKTLKHHLAYNNNKSEVFNIYAKQYKIGTLKNYV